MTGAAQNGAWLSVIIAIALAMLLLACILYLNRRYPGLTFVDYSRQALGKWLSYLILIPMTILVLVDLSYIVIEILARSPSSADRTAMKVIDSTTVSKAGIKLHLRLAFVGEDGVLPERATITEAKKNDRTQMDSLIDEEGVTYVFDRGYVDYGAFDSYCERGIHFVTRLKNNEVIEPLQSFEIPQGSQVTLDEKVRIGSLHKRTKHESG
ncbi:GerAB/ArcD/ProY family transporter [Paenibacillus solisilvae]|uniref:GerAB/ArcD/ProY family transporter n=1 Tax=Paenibacillus solisilvae TaxID=2486751 RepID=A0ABW0W383_9BACL